MRALVLWAVVGCSSPTVAPSVCATDPRVETFQTGLAAKGLSGSTITIVNATPSVVQQGLNEWVVSIKDSSGAPLDGMVQETARMPDHNHGSPTPSTVTAMGGGRYDINGINLSMRGVWTITISVTTATLSDSTTFTFCVDGAS
jgi:hypothetical protein